MYKIYINDKPIIFSQEHIQPNMPEHKIAILSESDDLKFNQEFLSTLESYDSMIIHTSDEKNSFENFCEDLGLIEAAGGLVYNEDKDAILFIYRREKWDLPKGKIDKGEGIQEAAIREVQEECGLKSVVINNFFDETFHIYQMKKKWYLKKTYWFNMQSSNTEKLIPQIEEDITALEWIPVNDFSKVKENTYAMIRDMIDEI